MNNTNCGCTNNCGGIAVAVSVLIGIVSAILSFFAVITVTPAFLWVTLGIAVVYLALTFVTASLRGSNQNNSDCLCPNLRLLLTGILGTILTSVILLGVTFAATSVIGAIITGALLLFFSLIITSVACLIKCLTRCLG